GPGRRRLQDRVVGLEGPADEGGEGAAREGALLERVRVGGGAADGIGRAGELEPFEGDILLSANDLQVREPVVEGLDVPEHHGGGAREAEAMGVVHDAHPVVGHRLERGNAPANGVDEDFAAPSGDAAEAGRGEVTEDLLDGFVKELGKRDELAGTEAMDVEAG